MLSSPFARELEALINCHSLENESNTPDFILAVYVKNCLAAFNEAVNAREQWYGREPNAVPVELQPEQGN